MSSTLSSTPQSAQSSKTSSFLDSTEASLTPLPNDFMNYYPWACGQFQLGVEVVVSKMLQTEYVGTSVSSKFKRQVKLPRNIMKAHVSRMEIVSEDNIKSYSDATFNSDPVIKLTAVCNLSDKVTHVKFEKSQWPTPKKMLVILGLFIRFNPYLVAITMKNKIDQGVVCELSKVVSGSNIVEVYLDGCYVREANYHILLTESCALKVLSLARCTLTDTVLKTITDKLDHLDPTSRFLISLNLASNRITDVGARYIAEALRSNRRLAYLNLSGNSITDDGAIAILDTMLEFPIYETELVAARSRRYDYLQSRIKMINDLVVQITDEEFDKLKRKISKSPNKNKGINMPHVSRMDLTAETLAKIQDRAQIQADANLGPFIDPFYPLWNKDDGTYSYGNNTLQSLNLAYNNLTVISARKILEVLDYQKAVNRKPRGLINLNLEGNPFPRLCPKLAQINYMLEQAADSGVRSASVVTTKKARTKSNATFT